MLRSHSLCAATKKAKEAMAHSYSYMFGLTCTGLRFFAVYGPWGRPDMAMRVFSKAFLKGEPITLFNDDRMRRDFIYGDDVVEAIVQHAPMQPGDVEATYADVSALGEAVGFSPSTPIDVGVPNALKAPVLADLSNIYRAEDMRKRGFAYTSVRLA